MSIYKKRELIERITLIGPMGDIGTWYAWLYDEGYSIKRTGPKPISRYKYDMNKFKIVAERKMK